MAPGKKNAARLKATLVFIDETGFLMAPYVRTSRVLSFLRQLSRHLKGKTFFVIWDRWQPHK